MHGITRSLLLTNVRIWDSNLGTLTLMLPMVQCNRERIQGGNWTPTGQNEGRLPLRLIEKSVRKRRQGGDWLTKEKGKQFGLAVRRDEQD